MPAHSPATSPKIHAYLAHQGVGSRRQVEAMIAQGKVSVNNQTAQIGQRIDPATDVIKVNGKAITNTAVTPEYWLIYKPPGYVSTTHDELNRPTVLNIIPKTNTRIYPVGRLDKDSEGLMLLTNDGNAAYHLTHPKFETLKVYEVLVSTHPTEKALDFLRRGVKLKEGMTRPAEVEIVRTTGDGTWLEIQIHEGKYHHVRRILERAGYETVRLIRRELGPFTTDDLRGQRYRKLTDEQIHMLQRSF